MTELVRQSQAITPWPHSVERLIERWQEGRSPHTVRAYGRDLAHFARWSTAAAADEAIARLLTGSMGEATSACMPTAAPCWTLALRRLPSTAGCPPCAPSSSSGVPSGW